ncbi:MaoC family dehydratase [Hydrocarboniphaga effusa]|uniref:MaoC family dehydratase n=1 Tax=Hydrocarboniphaga effusa TaxID=243629 RepID=UPI003BA88A58
MPIMLKGLDGIRAHAGFQLGKSGWIEVTQEMINTFADATDDYDWLHVDEAKAKEGPFGGTIAHGYHTLSLVIPLLHDIYVLEDVGVGLHYGVDRLRFPAPVPVNSSVRLSARMKSAEPIGETIQMTLECTMECDSSDKPVLYAEIIFRYWPNMRPGSIRKRETD